jgi:hypothetical protein
LTEAGHLGDEQAQQNASLSKLWRALEYLPLPHREETENGWVESRRVYGGKGWREINSTLVAHESLKRRSTPVKNVHWKDAQRRIT